MGIFTCSILAIGSSNSSSDTLFTIRYIIVATVFLFLLWGFSKYLTKRHFIGLREKNIKVIERVALSNDKFLYLIELDHIFYLVGSDKSGMTMIDKREHLNIEISKQIEPQTDAFFEQLKSSLLKKIKKNQSEEKSDD